MSITRFMKSFWLSLLRFGIKSKSNWRKRKPLDLIRKDGEPMCDDPEGNFNFFKGGVVAIVGGGVIWLFGFFLLKFLGWL